MNNLSGKPLFKISIILHNEITYNRARIHSTRSPFATLLSRRAQSGRRSYFGKRLWFTDSHRVLIIYFLLVVLFTYFIVDKIKKTSSVYDCTVEDVEYICNSNSTLCLFYFAIFVVLLLS